MIDKFKDASMVKRIDNMGNTAGDTGAKQILLEN